MPDAAGQVHCGHERGHAGQGSAAVVDVRLILAALKDKDIEARGLGREATTDDEILGLLQKMIKQRVESIETYDKHGRVGTWRP